MILNGNIPSSSFDIAVFAGAILTVISTIYLTTLSTKKQIERERYDKLIFPLFNLIEPYLFMKKEDFIFQQVISIINDNKSLAGGRLLYICFWCEKDPSQELYIRLCSTINSEFDRACRILGLKQRSVLYRLDRNQYRTQLMFFVYIIACVCTLLVSILALMLIATFLISVLPAIALR